MLSTNKTKLVRLAAALALLGTASFGAMAEWKWIGENSTGTRYVDPNTIRQSGHMAKMWSLVNYKSAKASSFGAYLSTRSRYEYDCNDERSRLLDLSLHSEGMAGGLVLRTVETANEPWESVPPDTLIEMQLKIACGIK